jgi:hypothetical protein
MQTKTFQNLQQLQVARDFAKSKLGREYETIVGTYVALIEETMKNNEENHFSAAARINNTELTKEPIKKVLLAAALMELTEKINLKETL